MAGAFLNGNGNGRRGHYRPMSEINVTPLVDVMLVLLVVFMVTAPLINPGQIELPQVVAQPVPEIGVTPGVPLPPRPRAGGCGCASSESGASGALGAAIVMLIVRRRRGRS